MTRMCLASFTEGDLVNEMIADFQMLDWDNGTLTQDNIVLDWLKFVKVVNE